MSLNMTSACTKTAIKPKYTLASPWLLNLKPVCRKLSGHVGISSHHGVSSSFSLEIDLCDVPTCGRPSVFSFLCQDCTLLIPSFNSGTASSLPLLLLFLTVSAAAALVLSAPSPCTAPSGWRVSMVCNDSVLSAGFQIDTPDTLGRTCLHAAAAGGWGLKILGWFPIWGSSVSSLLPQLIW